MEPGKPPNSITNQASPKSLDQPTDADLKEVRVIAESSARYYGARAHEIDEVAQDTVIKVWERWTQPNMVRARNRRGLRWAAYIRKIAKNQHLTLVRSNGRLLDRQRRASGARAPRPTRPLVHRQTDEQGVDEMHERIQRDFIISLFDQLPERQRMVAHMVFVEELTPAEIGELFGTDPQAVRKSLRAARERLKVLIHEAIDDLDTYRDLEDV